MKEKMTKEELYKALYTVLDNGKKNELSLENNDIRNKTLKTLLGEKIDLKAQIEKYNKIQKAREELGNQDANATKNKAEIFDDIVKYWKAIHHLYVCYLNKLKSFCDNKTINKILIYEAPPMPSDEKDSEKDGKINYILAQSCVDCNKSCKDCEINCELFKENPDGNYKKTIEQLKSKEGQKIQEILVNQGILFIDLCPLPLPMTTIIRKSVWGKDFVDEGKPLTVVLLELALRFALEKGIKISEKPIIAMGTPTATSQSIYLYFEKMKNDECPNPYISINVIDEVWNIDFSKLLEINEKYDKENQILPLYKSNIIAGSNTPNAELLERIFENPVKI